MAQDTLLGFPAHTLPYRCGGFTTLSTVSGSPLRDCLRPSKKWHCHFFEKVSLRSAPRLSADSGQFDACFAQSVFCHAQVAAENKFYSFRVCGRETLRGFIDSIKQAVP